MKQKTTIEVFQGKKGWFFHTVAQNGEIGTQSEAYTRKTSAVRGAKRWHPGMPIVLAAARK